MSATRMGVHSRSGCSTADPAPSYVPRKAADGPCPWASEEAPGFCILPGPALAAVLLLSLPEDGRFSFFSLPPSSSLYITAFQINEY